MAFALQSRASQKFGRGRRRGGSILAISGALVLLALCAAAASTSAFVGAARRSPGLASSRGAALRAEAEAAAPSPSPSPSVALVKVTEENKVTTASVLGGLAGLLVGGVWVGAGVFAAGAYLSRKEDSDVSKALKGVASGSLEVLNFGAYLNDKYAVTDRLGSAISEAVDGAKEGSNKESVESVTSFIDGAVDAVKAADKDIDFKGSFGTLAASASDLASQAVEKAIEVNETYKITDQIKEKIDEATSGAKASSA